jgi:hypothetical protein
LKNSSTEKKRRKKCFKGEEQKREREEGEK